MKKEVKIRSSNQVKTIAVMTHIETDDKEIRIIEIDDGARICLTHWKDQSPLQSREPVRIGCFDVKTKDDVDQLWAALAVLLKTREYLASEPEQTISENEVGTHA